MPTFPSTVTPKSISPFNYKFVKLLYEFDKGYKSTRSQYSKPLRNFSWEFLGLTATEKIELTNFIQLVRGETSTFDINWPFGHTVIGATNATPIVVTVQYYHNFLNGDSVTISGVEGNTNANGTFVLSNVTLNTFTLVGSAGNGTFADVNNDAVAKLKLTNVKFVFNEGLSGEITKILGPDSNNSGIYHFLLSFEQIY